MSDFGTREISAMVPLTRRGSRSRNVAQSHNGTAIAGLLIAAMSGGLFWLVSIYASGLRDPRYLDGWLLAGGLSLQMHFHIAVKTARSSPKSTMRWRKIHIFCGYLLTAAFISHLDFSIPDTGFEWALAIGFVLVALSGIFSTYLTWSRKAKREIGEYVSEDLISTRETALAQAVQALVAMTDPAAAPTLLPAPPYHVWIVDLYTGHLRHYFEMERNVIAHLTGSQRPLKRVTEEIENLSRYVDKQSKEKLEAIKTLAVEKDRLDFARVHLALTKGWLFVHVPVTYALIVLTVLHVLVVYAFSSGTP